jgi:hypothetical protein
MKQYNLKTWEGYRTVIQDIREKYGYLKLTEDISKKNVVLFRGHGNAEWPILTTLERKTSKDMSFEEYIRYALRCRNELESFMGRKWDIPQLPEILKEISGPEESWKPIIPYSVYNYLVYLRHNGFPSPLLDWTTSPYIAAYFSFCEEYSYERAAVYAYIERPTGVKGGMRGDPTINLMGPYVTTHSRHFAQKAWYTTATKYNYSNKEHIFCNHAKVFNRNSKDQDIIIKITIPSSERLKALEELSDYNINHFTLFQTEESLVKALSIKEFDLEGK